MRSSRLARLCAPLFLLSVAPAITAAQAPPATDESTRVWGTIGLGLGGWENMGDQGANAALGWVLQATGQRGHGLLTARMSGVATPFAGGVMDAGLLYGRASERGNWRLSAAAGLAWVQWWDELWDTGDDTETTVGVPLAAEALWMPGRHFGLGLQAFGNLNSTASFGAGALVMSIGNLRPRPQPQLAQRSPFASR